MSKPAISEQEQISLRNDAKEKLVCMEIELSDPKNVQVLNRFKNKYNICETVYKVILAEYQKKKNKNVKAKDLKVNMGQVPAALQFAGYSFDKEFLRKIFGSEKTSAKKLRDAVTHGIDKKAVTEIVKREKELFEYMDEFISTIRNFDDISA